MRLYLPAWVVVELKDGVRLDWEWPDDAPEDARPFRMLASDAGRQLVTNEELLARVRDVLRDQTRIDDTTMWMVVDVRERNDRETTVDEAARPSDAEN